MSERAKPIQTFHAHSAGPGGKPVWRCWPRLGIVEGVSLKPEKNGAEMHEFSGGDVQGKCGQENSLAFELQGQGSIFIVAERLGVLSRGGVEEAFESSNAELPLETARVSLEQALAMRR